MYARTFQLPRSQGANITPFCAKPHASFRPSSSSESALATAHSPIDARKSAISLFSPAWEMTARAAAGSLHCSSKVASVRRVSSRAGSTCTAFCASLNAAVRFPCAFQIYYKGRHGWLGQGGWVWVMMIDCLLTWPRWCCFKMYEKSRRGSRMWRRSRGSDLSSDKAASIRPSSSVRMPMPASALIAVRFSGSCVMLYIPSPGRM